jgi:DNA-binding GntR family transcriptional regulator
MDRLPSLDIDKLAAPLRQRVEQALREAIVAGKLPPGRRLPERDLTEMTGVSRALIREALRQLESEGLIDVVPNRGAVVRHMTPDEAKDLYAIRALLEGFAARRFVEQADDATLKRLMQAVDEVVAAYRKGDLNAALERKNTLYDVLFAGANSETLSAMVANLHARMRRWRALGVTHPARSARRSAEAIRDLKAMAAAIGARDAEEAERSTRQSAHSGAAEILHLLADNEVEKRTRLRRARRSA